MPNVPFRTSFRTLGDLYCVAPPDPYRDATTSTSSGELDRSTGRAFKINGDIFFSPNCQRTPTLPSPAFNPMHLRDSFQDTVQEFHEPLWWHPTTAYLAFVPLELVFHGVPFQALFSIPPYFDRVNRGFMLDTAVFLKWNVVQHQLKFAVARLLSHHGAPELRWIIPTALRCLGSRSGVFKHPKDLRERVTRSRDWFSVFVAGLSYAIAVSVTISDDPIDGGIPHWFCFLSSQQLEQIWLSGIQASAGATFSPYVARAGVLLKVLQPEPGQFSVDWLCRFHVPVWYPWGSKEAQAAICDSEVARLAPLPHQLQEISTFLTKTPQDKTSDSGSHASKPWEAFFAERALRNERCREKETLRQRQSREDREKRPPTKKCKVYVWRRDADGGYTRESIFQAENETELDFYGRNQKVYDAFSNCWDLCDDFGAVESDEFDPNDFDDFLPDDPPPIASSSRPTHAFTPPHDFSPPNLLQSEALQPEALPVPRIATSGYSYEEYETSQLLYEFLGFVHPLPLPPTSSSSLDKRSRGLIAAISGLSRDDAAFYDAPAAPFAADFLAALNTSKSPKNQSWDLARSNRLALTTAKRLNHVRFINGVNREEIEGNKPANKGCKLYLFDFRQAASAPWIIAVPDPTNVLFLCRLDASLTDYELARELLNRGIQFHTLLPLPCIRPSPPALVSVPIRLPGYEFTSKDYHAYVQERSALLADTRVARAALLRGGMVWRLAMATLSFDDVLQGPSVAATLYHRGVCFKTGDDPVELCDDGLSQVEYDTICGLYRCYTGEGNQHALKSWWPMDSTWNAHSSHAHWNEMSEAFFDRRLQELEGGKPEPLTAKSWRNRIRAPAHIRRVNTFMRSSSAVFLEGLPVEPF